MTYPKYYKSIAHDVKVISPNESVWVGKRDIQAPEHPIEDYIAERHYIASTEKEFKAAFNKTSKYLKSLI